MDQLEFIMQLLLGWGYSQHLTLDIHLEDFGNLMLTAILCNYSFP